MFDLIFKEYDLDIAKADATFESAKNIFDIQLLESSYLIKNGFLEESSYECGLYEKANENFLQKLGDFFKSLKDAFVKLINGVIDKAVTAIKKKQVNNKLKEIKKVLASNKMAQQKVSQKKIKIFDSASYTRAYTKYINAWVTESRKLYSKVYKSADEYKKAVANFDSTMEKYADKLNINKTEKYYIETNGINALKMTDKEIENISKSAQLIRKDYERALEKAENMASHNDDPSKVSDIKRFANKLSSRSSVIVKKVMNSSLAQIAAVFGLLSLVEYGIGNAIGKSDGKRKGYNDGFEDNLFAGIRARDKDEYSAGYTKGFKNAY